MAEITRKLSDAVHMEKAPVIDELVEYMNNLDPPPSEEEVRKVVRKIDMRLPPFLFILYVFTWLDRGALGNAVLMNIREDLGFTSSTFALAVGMFFVGCCTAELFANIGMRYVRPSWWCAGAMIIWGVFATLQAVAGSPGGMYAIRFFLGIFESAFIAGAPYMVSLMYPRASVGKRLSFYLASTPFAGAFGGWIAYGVAHIQSSSVKTWQVLFLIEGLLTILFGLLCLWVLPDRAHNTKWLTPRERDVAEWRMMQDGNRTRGAIVWNVLYKHLLDWRMWVNISIYICQVLSTYTISTFTPVIVATMGYDNVQAQLMTAPPFCVALVMCFVIGWLSDRIRSCSGLLAPLTCIAILGDLILVLLPIENGRGRYAGVFLVQLGILPCITLAVGNIINNSCGDIKKGVAIGIYLATGSTMGVATGYLFPETDQPKFTKGFWVLFGTASYVATAALVMTQINKRENMRRDKAHGKKPTDRVVNFDEDGLMEQHPFWRYYL
ncbi:hypothetical protein LTR37_006461 [Vermiconidia calcicola]|uniref:Uncharacterized protein n=1 Tax=Vermiconidia calcicola TaxID=1690605 RepID=A0ACC3NFV5_9PEZI|nr:hypothetical protein LTR37_006461 [Vermiconidia calcicola]